MSLTQPDTDAIAPFVWSDLAERIERASVKAAQPPEHWMLDGWQVNLSPGLARRSRSIQPLDHFGCLSLHDKVHRAEQHCLQSGLPPLFRISPMCRPPELDALLALKGYRQEDDYRVMTLPLAHVHPETSREGLCLRALSTDLLAAKVGTLRGFSPSQIRAHQERLQEASTPFHAYVLEREGQALAFAQMAQEGDLAGFYDVFTRPEYRGLGLARELLMRLLALARTQGIRHAYLQVEAANITARRLYKHLGFQDLYAYHYRVR